MPTPDFVLQLRERIGHDLLWLPGVTAVILRDGEAGTQVLLVKRADNGAWTPVTGIVDPGEEPAAAGAREAREEADVVAVPEALVRVRALEPITYDNGDVSQYLDLTYRFRWVSGEPHPADGENTQARWFSTTDLPELSTEMSERIGAALRGDDRADFLP